MPLGVDGVFFAVPRALYSMGIEETGEYRGKPRSHPDKRIAALADRQHGVVATWQLRAIGLGPDAIWYRVQAGRLHRIHRGVYAVGHRKLTRQGHWMAAVLAYGPDATLSHRTASALWGFGAGSYKIDVTTPHGNRGRAQIRVHRAVLHFEDVLVRDGIPVTSVARTILDLAAQLELGPLTQLIEDSDRRDLFDLKALDRAIARRPRAAGIGRLRAVLGAYRGTADTRSKLERAFRALIAGAGLPEPQFNVLVAGVLVDVWWPQWKLVVELDSEPYHATPSAFESDRIRDATLQKADIRVLRVTGERLDNAPRAVLGDVLALRRRPPAP